MKKSLTLFIALTLLTIGLTACGKILLTQEQIEAKLLKIIDTATISDIKFVDDEAAPYYEGNMSNSYADYYFKLDAYTGKTLDWKRTIKYLSTDEITEFLKSRYANSSIDSLNLVVGEDGSRTYTGIVFNKIAYYKFEIDAFDSNHYISWKDVSMDYLSIDKSATFTTRDGKEYASEYTVRRKLNSKFDRLYLSNIERSVDGAGNPIYVGEFTIDDTTYSFTADPASGEIVSQTAK